jgi:hypothetical protein
MGKIFITVLSLDLSIQIIAYQWKVFCREDNLKKYLVIFIFEKPITTTVEII